MEYIIHDNYYRDDLDNREVVVSVKCLTYNHEKYIAEALEGFIKQKTNFRFEVIVHDDCSTDGTAAIIREYATQYPSIIKPIFETENQYSKKDGSLRRIIDSHIRGKYVAYCEGDDYWTDPLKLQKQVDFLDHNANYTLVCSHANFYDQIKECFRPIKHRVSGPFDVNFLISNNIIVTCTVMIRHKSLQAYEDAIGMDLTGLPFADYQKWIYASIIGKCMLLKDAMSVYRVSPAGVSHNKTLHQEIKWMHSIFAVTDYFCNNYPIEDEAVKQAYFIRFKDYAYLAAIWNDKAIYKRALTFYKTHGYHWTKLFLQLAHSFPKLKPLWTYINIRNKITLQTTKTYDNEII